MAIFERRYWFIWSLVSLPFLYLGFFYYEGDPFLKAVKDTARQSRWQFTDELDKYIPPGTAASEAFAYLGNRGFAIFESEPKMVPVYIRQGILPNQTVYVAWREWWPSPLVKVKVNIVLIIDNEEVIVSTYGINSLTGL